MYMAVYFHPGSLKMAVETTTITPAPTQYPVIGSGAPRPNFIPRGEIAFFTENQIIAVPNTGDSQLVKVVSVLPPGFGYVLRYMSLHLSGVDIADWDTSLYACFRDQDNSKQLYDIGMDSGNVNYLGGRVFVPRANSIPGKTIISLGAGGEVCMHVANASIDGSAMTVRAEVVLLIFDLDQAYSWAINSPVSIR